MNNKINEDIPDIKKHSKKKKIIIISIFLILIIAAVTLVIIICSRNNEESKDENIKYLIDKYGNINTNILSKKGNKITYRLCSKITPFCTIINYDKKNKKWHYPKGEGFTYTITFMDQVINELESNNIVYYTYVDNLSPHDISNNFILIIKKEKQESLVNAITKIDNNNLIPLLCPNSNDDNCTGKFEINIFNSEDFDTIIKKKSKHYGIKDYTELYQILQKNDNSNYGNKVGNNIERHNINYDMFNCNDEYCINSKHIAYRYVIGNHNYAQNTIIIEGIN